MEFYLYKKQKRSEYLSASKTYYFCVSALSVVF